MTPSSPPWWSKDTVAVVTGANKGIGYAIVRQLAEQGLTVVLTARDPGRGEAAVDALKADGVTSLWFHQLDITRSDSVDTLAAWLKNQFGGFDILINNAGIGRGASEEIDYENAKTVLETNYYGTQRVTNGLLPVLRSSPTAARILNITSGLALYERLGSEKLKQIFRDEQNYTQELVDSLVIKYLDDVKADRWKEEWVAGRGAIYSVSKILLNAYSIVCARSLLRSQRKNHQIYLVTFTPGIVMTDLNRIHVSGNFKPPAGLRLKTPAEGADTGVWLALLPKEEFAEKNGKVYFERKEYPFGSNFLNSF